MIFDDQIIKNFTSIRITNNQKMLEFPGGYMSNNGHMTSISFGRREMNKKLITMVCALFCAALMVGIASAGEDGPNGKNLAEDKNATCSSFEKDDPQFAPGKAVDGYKQTRWSSNFFTDKAPDDAWWQVDLGDKTAISFITINFEAAYGKEFNILVSDDGKSWKKVLEVKDGKPGENIFKLPVPAEGRYVKYQGVKRGSAYGHSFFEFGVYSN